MTSTRAKTKAKRSSPAKSSLSSKIQHVQVRRRYRTTREDRQLSRAMRDISGPGTSIVLSQKSITASGATTKVRARYDAAVTTDDNRRHWANADSLSADASANPGVRRILRNRARYEVANNTYAKGIVLTLANDVIGTGPRLQMLLGTGENSGINGIIEKEFMRWAKAVNLAGKLRTMRMSRAQDGEAFAMFITNDGLDTPVKLDIRLIEADQVTTPDMALSTPGAVDGIVFDEYGNPSEYHVLKYHPGASIAAGELNSKQDIPAKWMIHWFRADRPGQYRGISEITPALPLFAQMRRYTLSVIDAAEAAADFAIVLFTKAPAGGEAESIESMDTIELTRRMMTTMPEGWEPGQIKPEQPATTYAEFKHEILNEIARCLNIPYNIAACNSSEYNYASGRMDHQTYYKSIRIDQSHAESVVLDRILTEWMAQAVLVSGYLPGIDMTTDLDHQWFWDGQEHVDPAKEANAQATRLASNTTTLASEYAKQGKDWETELRQRAKEVALMKELGLPLNQAQPASSPDASDASDEGDDAADEPPAKNKKKSPSSTSKAGAKV
jgi:lambda family phage portal protein